MTTADSMIYCVKCKVRTETKNVEVVTKKNGRDATRGVCGTGKYRIGK